MTRELSTLEITPRRIERAADVLGLDPRAVDVPWSQDYGEGILPILEEAFDRERQEGYSVRSDPDSIRWDVLPSKRAIGTLAAMSVMARELGSDFNLDTELVGRIPKRAHQDDPTAYWRFTLSFWREEGRKKSEQPLRLVDVRKAPYKVVREHTLPDGSWDITDRYYR